MADENIIIDDKTNPEGNSNVNDETPGLDNSQNWEGKVDYKQRYADSTKEYQKLSEQKTQLEHDNLVYNAYRSVLKDNTHLLDLDNKLAKDVVAQLHEDWYADTDSLEELIKSIKSESDDKPLDKDKLAKEIRQQILDEQNQEQAQKILDEALVKFDTKTKKLFLDEFKEIAGDRKLKPAFAKKEIDKIIVYYNREKTKNERDDEVLSNLASNWLWGWKSTSKTTMTTKKLEELWIPKSQQKTLYPELFTK